MAQDPLFNWHDFLLENPLFRQLKVDDLLFAAYDCPLEGTPIDYWVQKNYFCYIIKGGARWKTPKNDYTFKVGDGAFLTRGAHRVYKIGNGEFCALIIFLPDEFITAVMKSERPLIPKLSSSKAESDAVIPLNLDETLTHYFGSLLTYLNQPKAPPKNLLKLKFKELLLTVVTGQHNPKVTEYFLTVSNTGRRDIKTVMEEHFIFNLKMQQFADMSGRSLASFKRNFFKLYGTTPGKWLRDKRLEHSKYLLDTTDLNINEVSLNSGFENTSHFVKIFKQQYGKTPNRYRKTLKLV